MTMVVVKGHVHELAAILKFPDPATLGVKLKAMVDVGNVDVVTATVPATGGVIVGADANAFACVATRVMAVRTDFSMVYGVHVNELATVIHPKSVEHM